MQKYAFASCCNSYFATKYLPFISPHRKCPTSGAHLCTWLHQLQQEFFADILLCPFEACKVRIQTQPGWARTLREGMPKLHAEEGMSGFVVKSPLADLVMSPDIASNVSI